MFRVYREVPGNLNTLEFVKSFERSDDAMSFCELMTRTTIWHYFVAMK